MSRPDEYGETTAAQLQAVKKYDAAHTTSVHLKLNTRTDTDIIKWLWRQRSKQGAIKKLIRQEIEREEQER